ncbi:hypothetical protein ACFYXF_12040 [Streptomyces sp. NPDC002680]
MRSPLIGGRLAQAALGPRKQRPQSFGGKQPVRLLNAQIEG